MAGHNFGFVFDSDKEVVFLHETIETRLNEYFERYELSDDNISHVELAFR